MRRIDLTGHRFGFLAVIAEAGVTGRGAARWLCWCDCLTEKVVTGCELRRGSVKSCGCQRITLNAAGHTRHGMDGTPEAQAYRSAKHRCTNPNSTSWKDYGGRGIEFRFKSFEEFFAHIGPRPSADHSLDRIATNGHYELGNVRWATDAEQRANKRKGTPAQIAHLRRAGAWRRKPNANAA
jgi:hypothetical protein